MSFMVVGIVLLITISIWWSITPTDKERLDHKLEIGKNQIDTVMYRLLESSEYTTRCYSGRLDVLKNETNALIEPLYKNLTCDECKYIRRGLGHHIARRAKLTIPTN